MTPTQCCLWPTCMQGCIGVGTPGVRANEGVNKGEIWMICMNSDEFRTKFVRIHAYASATSLPGFATFRFGGCLGVVDAFGARDSLDDG